MTNTEARRERVINSKIWRARTKYAQAVAACKIALQVFPKDNENRDALMDGLMHAEQMLLEAIAAEAAA